jgi:hypothetical protein
VRISPRRLILAAFLALFGTLGCNSVFGIEEGQLGATSSSAASTSASATAGTSATSGSAGGGGAGGQGQGGSGGSGGAGGQGVGGGCGYYDGFADLQATGDGASGVGALILVASQSVSGLYVEYLDAVDISIGAGEVDPFCAVGVHLWLAGPLQLGTFTAGPIDPNVDQAGFGAGLNAYSLFQTSADTLPCDGQPAGGSAWESVSGTWTVDSIDGQSVVLHAENVVHMPTAGSPMAMGTVTLNGEVHDDCFSNP